MRSFTIIISSRASKEYEEIVQYITDNFGKIKAMDVEEKYGRVVNQIAKNPLLFSVFNLKKNIRKCVLSPQTTLYYSVADTHIELISFRNNFKNPKTLNI
jgi:plasmid stabilization system protein ParE